MVARVQTVAQSLYKEIVARPLRELQRELGWAAALHEIGMMVSNHDHHRHSAYLLAHVDAAGFSQNQLKRLGDLALGQRGGLRKLESQLKDETLLWQMVCLRLAVISSHGRKAVDVKALRLARQGRKAVLTLPSNWATEQPRALFQLQEEAQAWAKSGVLELALA